MNILITGAAGFLGRAFVEYHLAQGNRVVSLDDLSNPHSKFFGQPTKQHFHFMSRLQSFVKRDKLKGERFDLVYHFAAPVGGREKIERDPLFNAESLEIDSLLFRWAIDKNPQPVVVYPSSSAVYPVYLQNKYHPAQSMTGPRMLGEEDLDISYNVYGKPDELYGMTKLVGEVLANKAALYGLKTLVIRPFSGYGEGQSADYPFTAIMQRVVRHEDPLNVWGDGTQVRDWVHVSDIVGATEAFLQNLQSGVSTYNIGTGVGTSIFTLANIAANVEGYHPDVQGTEGKPTGVNYRVCDTNWMKGLYEPKIVLKSGIKRVLDYERARIGR